MTPWSPQCLGEDGALVVEFLEVLLLVLHTILEICHAHMRKAIAN
jgi:hypothetical protein